MIRSKKILCVGELLLHFAPDSEGNWLENRCLKTYIGGAEYNVANALAKWENPVKYLTALPQNFIGDQLENQLQKENIEVLAEKFIGRLGIFYLVSDSDMQHAQMVYDRFPSVFTESDFSGFTLDMIFENVSWLHISTITPALSENAYQKTFELMKDAHSRGIKVSFDLNFRAALWEGKDPFEKIENLMPFVTLLMGNLWSIEKFLNIPIEFEINGNYDDVNLLKQAEISAKKIQELFPNVEAIANTFRFTQGEEVNYFTTLFTDEKLLISEEYYAEKVEERVGSGDAFMAALIHGFVKGNELEKILEDATKVAFQKLFVKGDTIGETIKME